jgi:hypothetical protein
MPVDIDPPSQAIEPHDFARRGGIANLDRGQQAPAQRFFVRRRIDFAGLHWRHRRRLGIGLGESIAGPLERRPLDSLTILQR